ncbi:MAG: hypothetical protein ABR962_00325 [Candidatus Bathyarchaeia archaeon]|jgi:hypothetical protein
MNVPQQIQEELLRHLSNFVSDLDKIGGIIEEARPHHAVIRRWRKLKFEMEGDLSDALKIINERETGKITALKPQSTSRA